MISRAQKDEHYRNLRKADIAAFAHKHFKDRIRRETIALIEIDCPHHASQSHRSMHVYPKKGSWYCFGCTVGGDIIHLAEFSLFGKITTHQSGRMPETHRRARELVETDFGIPPLAHQGLSPEQVEAAEAAYWTERRIRALLMAVAEFYYERLKNNPQVLDWFKSHYAISSSIIELLKLGYAENKGIVKFLEKKGFTLREMVASGLFRPTSQDGVVPVFENRIVFPYWNGSDTVYMIARRTPWAVDNPYEQAKYKKLPVHDDDKHALIDPCIRNDYLFNEDLLLTGPKELIISEGVTDCITLMERGFPAISPATVKIRDEDWARLIPKFRNVATIYLSLDNEVSQVGLNASIKTASLLAKHHIQARLVILPLDEKQQKARRELSERFGITCGEGARDATKRLNLSQENCREVDQLAADSKIDVNEFFAAGHSPEEYRELLKNAQTPIEFAISALPTDASEERRNQLIQPILPKLAQLPDLEWDRHFKLIQARYGDLTLSTLRVATRAARKTQRSREKQERKQQGPALESQNSGLPTIDVLDLNLPKVSKQAWDALNKINSPAFLFQHVTGVVRIEKREETGEPIIRTLDEDRLRYEMARSANWIDSNTGALALPPKHLVRDLLAHPNPPLPLLKRTVEYPFFSKNRVLHATPGYLKETGCYYHKDPFFDLPPLPSKPTKGEIGQALAALMDELLGDFPFLGPAEKAHAIGLTVQPFVREMIPGPTPLYLIEAPGPGTGKSLLARVACYPALGREIPSMAEGRDEEEYRKRITAALCFSPAFVFVDNVRHKIDSAALASAITSTNWEDRILGQTQIIRLPVTSGWIATGNNPDLSTEMARRTVRIRLDAKTDRPWMRQGFAHPNIMGWVKKNRPRLVHAILTLAQAWISEGGPEPTGLPVFGMFEGWEKVIGGILQVVGIPGFLENLTELYENSDREGELKRAFTIAWWNAYGEQEVGVSELYNMVIEKDIPVDLGKGPSERSQKTKLGIWLSRFRDNQIGQLRIMCGSVRHSAQTWRLKAVVSNGSSAAPAKGLLQDEIKIREFEDGTIDLANFTELE